MKEEAVMHDRNIRVFLPTNLPWQDAVLLPDDQVAPLESRCLRDAAYAISNYECV